MLSLSSQLFGRRVLHSIRFNCIKTLQTKANLLEKTLHFSPNAGNNGFQQKLLKLDSNLKRFGRISFNELNQCLNELSKSKNIRPTTTQSLLLIRCCGALVADESPEKRRDLCQRIFETLSEATDLDVSHYNQLLRVFIENEYDFDAIQFLERMQTKGIDPNRVTFILMIERFCQKGNVSEAIRILEHMRSKDMAISESVFNSLIIGYGKAGDLQTAEQTLDMMRASGVEPSTDSYTSLLCAYALNPKNPEMKEKMDKIFDKMNKSEVELSETDMFKVVKTMALSDVDYQLMEQLLYKIQLKKSLNYNKECLSVINDLLFANKVDTALKLYDTMEAPEQQLKQRAVGNPLIRSMIRANVSPQIVFSVCERLQSEGKNESPFKTAAEYALNYSNLDNCRTYLKRLGVEQPLRVHFFYPVIIRCENENQILEVLSEEMNQFSDASYSQLIELFMDYIWPKNILDVNSFMEKCKQIGFSYVISFNSLIRYHISNDRINEAVNLLLSPNLSSIHLVKREIISDLADAVLRPNNSIVPILKALQCVSRGQKSTRTSEMGFIGDTFGEFLIALIRKRVPMIQFNQVLKEFDKMSIKISEPSVNAIRDRITLSVENDELLNKLKTTSRGDMRGYVYHDIDDITKPRREMTPDELEGHLIELKSKGLNTRGVLRNLLMAYCRQSRSIDENKSDVFVTEGRNRVLKILDELKASNHEFSNAMNTMVMDFFVNCGDIQSALEMKEKISKDFEIDFFKIINFATLYVKNGEIEKAIDLIKTENSRKSDTVDGEEINGYLNRSRDMSIFRLMKSLLEAKVDIKLLKEVFDLCINYSAQTPTGTMAGPLIEYHILKGDYNEALNEFQNFAQNYRITPWKSQLMKHFLEVGDQTNLQKVIDVSHKLHGEMNTVMDLAAVCIELGKEKQAKKLLDSPGLRVRQPKIDTICEQFVRDGKTDCLEKLIRNSKNLEDVIRDRMLYHLIRSCIRTESPEKALNCWTLMQEENIQPNDNTLILLANYLENNNITVPFKAPPPPVQTFRPKRDDQSPRLSDDPLHKFNEAIKALEIDEAIKIKNSLESEGKSLLMSQNCNLIEALLNSDRTDEAFDITKRLLSSKAFPSARVIRYLYSKLSSIGDYQRLEDLEPVLPEFLLQSNAYTNALSSAYISSGKVDELINEKLLQMKPFPLGSFLRALDLRPDLEERLVTIANNLVREQDFHLPLNMVWINFMKNERFEDAERIYKSCPKLKDFLLFTSLLDSIRENKNVVLAKKLIETLSESNLTPKSIGVGYSALIDAYLESGETGAAEDVVINEVMNTTKTRIDPKTESRVKLLDVEHLNRSTLNRLTKAIREKEGREPKFQINRSPAAASSSDEDSSDEEVVDIKNK